VGWHVGAGTGQVEEGKPQALTTHPHVTYLRYNPLGLVVKRTRPALGVTSHLPIGEDRDTIPDPLGTA
jgi:hypothetical protein